MSAIADAIGHGFTKNQVCGIVNREIAAGRLTRRTPDEKAAQIIRDSREARERKQQGLAPRGRKPKPVPRAKTFTILQPPSPVVAPPAPIVAAPTRVILCEWITSTGRPWTKCDKYCEKAPYCPEHAARAFVAVRPQGTKPIYSSPA